MPVTAFLKLSETISCERLHVYEERMSKYFAFIRIFVFSSNGVKAGEKQKTQNKTSAESIQVCLS